MVICDTQSDPATTSITNMKQMQAYRLPPTIKSDIVSQATISMSNFMALKKAFSEIFNFLCC